MADPGARRERETMVIAQRRPAIAGATVGVKEATCGWLASRSGSAHDADAARLSPSVAAGRIAPRRRGAPTARSLCTASAGRADILRRLAAARAQPCDHLAS